MQVYKFTSPARVGVPDRMFAMPHQHLFFIEFKRPGAKPTPVQEREARKLVNCGFAVYLVDNIEEGIKLINAEFDEGIAKQRVFVGVMKMQEQMALQEKQQSGATSH
jgi:hypothetical protein